MPNYNRTISVGHLTRDPELKYLPSGMAVCSFGLAMSHKYKKNEEWKTDVCFIEITVWAKSGENCNQYLKKGSAALVEGRLKLDTWEDNNGNKRSKHSIVATNVQFLSKKEDNEGRSERREETTNEAQESQGKDEPPFPNDDEIPF